MSELIFGLSSLENTQSEMESALFINECPAPGVEAEHIMLGATLDQLRNHFIPVCLEISEGYQ